MTAECTKNMLRRLNAIATKVRRNHPRAVTAARILSILLVVAAGFDVISTTAALAAGHVEANPVVRGIQASLGEWWSAPKMGVHLVLGLLILWYPTRKMISIARLVVSGYLVIIINNFYLAGWLI